AGPACGHSRTLMCTAANTAPNAVCANPCALPPLSSRGPAVADTGTVAPATLTQDTSGGAELSGTDGSGTTAAVAGGAAVVVATARRPDTAAPRCPNATTKPATVATNPSNTSA